MGGVYSGIDDADCHSFSRQSLIPGGLHSNGLHPPLIPKVGIIGCLQQFHRSVPGFNGLHRIEIFHTV